MSDNNGAAQLWTTAQTELRLQFTPNIYEMYIHPLRLVDMNEAGEISLACPNTFTRDWLEQRLDRVVSRTCSAIAGRTITTRYLLAPAGQLPLVSDGQPTDRGENGDGSSSFYVRPGDLRPAGYVQLWHDLRTLYGPRIGLAGVGLWAEFRAAIQERPGHPLAGYAWIGLRAIQSHYQDGRIAVERALTALKGAKLLDWKSAQDLAALWTQQRAAGIPDRDNAGVPAAVLGRFLSDPVNSRIYSINDPAELPEFCCKFDLSIRIDPATGQCQFPDYPGRISARWQDWLKRLMAANGLTAIGPDDFRRLGLQ